MTPLYIHSAGMCCAVGHHTRAARCALRAGIDHFRETQFIDESGQPLNGAALYGIDVWGEERQAVMFTAVLSEVLASIAPELHSQVAVLVLCAEASRNPYAHEYALRLLENAMQRDAISEQSAVLAGGKA